MRSTSLLIVALVLSLAAVARAQEPKPSAPVPDGYKLVYSNDCDSPDILKSLVATDPKAWKHSSEGKAGGALELAQQSKYKYKVRSPLNIALIDNLVLGDFVLECDMRQTGKEYGHRDMCVFFGFNDRNHFYYVHMATKTDDHAHNVFIVNDQPRTKVSHKTTDGVDWGKDAWQHIRIERDAKAGTVKVYFNDMKTPIMEAKDTTFAEGYLGFGSFDDTGRVDNIRIWAPSAKEGKLGNPFKDGQ